MSTERGTRQMAVVGTHGFAVNVEQWMPVRTARNGAPVLVACRRCNVVLLAPDTEEQARVLVDHVNAHHRDDRAGT